MIVFISSEKMASPFTLSNVAQIISILSGKLGPLVFVNVRPKGVCMSISHLSIDNRDPASKHAPSIYPELVHADESEILSWAVKTAISDLGTVGTGHTDNLAMRQDIHERKRVLLMLLNRLMDG